MIDSLNPVVHEVLDFIGRDRAAAATEHFDVPGTAVSQPIDHVAEKFFVPALVRTDGDAVGIFLDRGTDNVVHAAVVAEVNDFNAARLDKTAHDINCRVMTVEQ